MFSCVWTNLEILFGNDRSYDCWIVNNNSIFNCVDAGLLISKFANKLWATQFIRFGKTKVLFTILAWLRRQAVCVRSYESRQNRIRIFQSIIHLFTDDQFQEWNIRIHLKIVTINDSWSTFDVSDEPPNKSRIL